MPRSPLPAALVLGAALGTLGVLAGCGADGPPATGFHVAGGFLRDAQGRAVVMRGINLSGDHKSKPYFGWHQPADLARLRTAWGMNAIRLLTVWAAVEPQRGSYDERYLDELARRVEWARDAGLLVVVDMHQDVYGEGFGGDGAPRWTCDEALYAAHQPTSPWFANYASAPVMTCFDRLYTDPDLGARFAAAWRRVAQRLARYTETVVGGDVLNEPHWGSASVWSFERDRLQPFYERAVRAVREAAPGWVAFLEPASSRNIGFATGLQSFAARGLEHVVYAPHAYDTSAEQGLGFDPARREAVLANGVALAAEARTLGAALWIGELGGVASNPGIGPYMDAEYDAAAAAAASTMYWDYGKGGGYGPLAADGSEKPELLAALVRPYPERVAGDPVSYDFDEGSATFTLVYRPDRQSAAPTEIVLPDRVYPKGFVVSCDGCVHEKRPQALRVTTPPAGEIATVKIRRP